VRLPQQLFVTDILHFFYTPEKGTLRRFLPNRRLWRREQAHANESPNFPHFAKRQKRIHSKVQVVLKNVTVILAPRF
jgi:hypothetical protein